MGPLPAPSTHWVYGDSRGDLYAAKAWAHGVTKYNQKGQGKQGTRTRFALAGG